MNFLEFYSNHYVSLTVIFIALIVGMIGIIIMLVSNTLKDKSVKTPWFEIGAESVKEPESMESNRTRLLISRQMDFVDKYIDGLQPVFLNVEKVVVDEAMKILFNEKTPPKTHMQTCLIQSTTTNIIVGLKNYVNKLLVMNHIGTDKEKIEKYANGHVNAIVGIVRKELCDLFCKLSGQVCMETMKYWEKSGISNPKEWTNKKFTELLLDLSDLRYSDFNTKFKEEKK